MKVNKGDLIAVDFDMTLTRGSPDPYKRGGEIPNDDMIDRVRRLVEDDKLNVIIWTARPWSHAPHIVGLLTQWQVPYHGLRCEKGGAELYLDDKALNVNDIDKLEIEE